MDMLRDHNLRLHAFHLEMANRIAVNLPTLSRF
ncbi:hypothetical protein SAMN04488082_104120 [Desulfomicrobium apsheronum]|uniref:Uncharacterized protein n=1 Tax=Desulfomicrobium apsheronum TaxID=52560 RepID=A0A1I3SFE4_9BACT|nr:hypothetical protein SAMN04488082_104120 [Desulfomicrobium apsheronum]